MADPATSILVISTALGGILVTVASWIARKVAKKDCSDCIPMKVVINKVNALSEAMSSLIIHSDTVPENEKIELNSKLTRLYKESDK